MNASTTALLDMLATAVQRGDFVLASGAKSDYYLDARRVTMSPRGAVVCGCVLYQLAQELGAEAIVGPVTAAIPLVTSTVLTSFHGDQPMWGAYVRLDGPKGHGMGKRVDGNVPPAAKVLMVDDVGTSGRSLARAAEVLQDEHPSVSIVGSTVLVDRAAGAASNLIHLGPYRPLFSIKQVLEMLP